MSTSSLLVGSILFGQLTQFLIQFVHGSRCTYIKGCWGCFECDRKVLSPDERHDLMNHDDGEGEVGRARSASDLSAAPAEII